MPCAFIRGSAPAKPLVAKGDHVLKGQIIAEAGGFISANVLSSVSGTVKGIESKLVANGAMVQSILAPSSSFKSSNVAFSPQGQLELDEQGYIRADESGQTSVPGVFAAGDVRTKALRADLIHN